MLQPSVGRSPENLTMPLKKMMSCTMRQGPMQGYRGPKHFPLAICMVFTSAVCLVSIHDKRILPQQPSATAQHGDCCLTAHLQHVCSRVTSATRSPTSTKTTVLALRTVNYKWLQTCHLWSTGNKPIMKSTTMDMKDDVASSKTASQAGRNTISILAALHTKPATMNGTMPLGVCLGMSSPPPT
jgi:hypothetical protein